MVADLETTGLSGSTDEILEIGALIAGPNGVPELHFSVLVWPTRPVPGPITELTGITQAEVDKDGVPLAKAMAGLKSFVGDRPVFFHNAPFDQAFLTNAGATTGITLANPVFDSLPLAREAWPDLKNHKLATLASHVGATVRPSHRALGDAKATLAVLRAAALVKQSEMAG